jgi:DNA helicase-2/ATP-dependent DNA helicase PcrA
MDTGYIAELKESDEEDVDDRIANIDELISKVVSYEESAEAEHPDEPPTLSGFLEDVALVADIDEVGEEDDRVLLMTLHSAKGLEFSHVYLAGMEDGIFPGQMTIASGDSEDMEEERRLAYVGITRAKDELTLTCARARMLRGETKYNPVSRFVYEIPDNLLDGRPKALRRITGMTMTTTDTMMMTDRLRITADGAGNSAAATVNAAAITAAGDTAIAATEATAAGDTATTAMAAAARL